MRLASHRDPSHTRAKQAVCSPDSRHEPNTNMHAWITPQAAVLDGQLRIVPVTVAGVPEECHLHPEVLHEEVGGLCLAALLISPQDKHRMRVLNQVRDDPRDPRAPRDPVQVRRREVMQPHAPARQVGVKAHTDRYMKSVVKTPQYISSMEVLVRAQGTFAQDLGSHRVVLQPQHRPGNTRYRSNTLQTHPAMLTPWVNCCMLSGAVGV